MALVRQAGLKVRCGWGGGHAVPRFRTV